jgi:hypothetical protein
MDIISSLVSPMSSSLALDALLSMHAVSILPLIDHEYGQETFPAQGLYGGPHRLASYNYGFQGVVTFYSVTPGNLKFFLTVVSPANSQFIVSRN